MTVKLKSNLYVRPVNMFPSFWHCIRNRHLVCYMRARLIYGASCVSSFPTNPHNRHPIACLWGWNKGCILWILTHCGLVTPFGDIDLGQHWLRQWLGAWRHQAITWTNVALSSVRFSGIHLRAISSEIPQLPFTKVSLKITFLKLNWNLPGANELSLVFHWFYSAIMLSKFGQEFPKLHVWICYSSLFYMLMKYAILFQAFMKILFLWLLIMHIWYLCRLLNVAVLTLIWLPTLWF